MYAHIHVVCSSDFNTGFQIGTIGGGTAFQPQAQEPEMGYLVDASPSIIQVLVDTNGMVRTFGFKSSNSGNRELRVTLKYIGRRTV